MKRLSLAILFIYCLAGYPAFAQILEERVTERLPRLSHVKIEALLKRVQVTPPSNFYNCLCEHVPHFDNVGVSYHPGPTGSSGSCSKPGLPCTYAGYGCSRRAFPTDPKAWSSCLKSCKYKDGTTLVNALATSIIDFREHQETLRDVGAQKYEIKSDTFSDIDIPASESFKLELSIFESTFGLHLHLILFIKLPKMS